MGRNQEKERKRERRKWREEDRKAIVETEVTIDTLEKNRGVNVRGIDIENRTICIYLCDLFVRKQTILVYRSRGRLKGKCQSLVMNRKYSSRCILTFINKN